MPFPQAQAANCREKAAKAFDKPLTDADSQALAAASPKENPVGSAAVAQNRVKKSSGCVKREGGKSNPVRGLFRRGARTAAGLTCLRASRLE